MISILAYAFVTSQYIFEEYSDALSFSESCCDYFLPIWKERDFPENIK
jgi:hypothetical protein